MACRYIDSKFVYIDCEACNGSGSIATLEENGPVKQPCGECHATCLVKIPIKQIPVSRAHKVYTDLASDMFNTIISLSAKSKV
jgi:DnaJ-class molecular chaperone